MVVFIFLFVTRNTLSGGKLGPEIQNCLFKVNLIPRLVRMSKIQWRCSLFFDFDQEFPFWAKLLQKIKIVSLS